MVTQARLLRFFNKKLSSLGGRGTSRIQGITNMPEEVYIKLKFIEENLKPEEITQLISMI